MVGMGESSNTHPLNAAGDFYVVNGLCMACTAPEHEAATLIGHSNDQYHCYFKRQPQTPQETELAIRAVTVSCCAGLRYRGHDKKVITRLTELGSRDSCDYHKFRRRWFRFSLRTLLVVVTVAAIVCAIVSAYVQYPLPTFVAVIVLLGFGCIPGLAWLAYWITPNEDSDD